MGANQAKHGSPDHPSSTVHLRDKKDLAGVGIIFRKNADGSLVVKDLIDGSGAEECKQIELGDTLTQVDDIKINKVSIAEVSGMILGEPGQTVRLKFTRNNGRTKRKYKVVLKRTVRATLEPTYRVQRDGVNTRVTHIHLDCLQNQNGSNVDSSPGIVRDVLDANGNLVGPGLLESNKAASAREPALPPNPCPGVERIDASHPAWPGNNSRATTVVSGTSNTVKSVKKKNPSKAQTDGSSGNPNPVAVAVPEAEKPSSSMDSYGAPANIDDLFASFMSSGLGDTNPPLPQLPPMTQRAVSPPRVPTPPPPRPPTPPQELAPQLPPPSPKPQAPAVEAPPQEAFIATAEPANGADDGASNWEGLTESRIAVFEARERQADHAKRGAPAAKVDLEREWARTARAAQAPAPPPASKSLTAPLTTTRQSDLPSSSTPPAPRGSQDEANSGTGGAAAFSGIAAGLGAGAAAGRGRGTTAGLDGGVGPAAGLGGSAAGRGGGPAAGSGGVAASRGGGVAAGLGRAAGGGGAKEGPVRSGGPSKDGPAKAGEAPGKLGAGRGSLEALMAARRRQTDEGSDEGYYF